ncbi:MAG: type 1 glutamine amidotransferase [Methanotrichaceae archaeon]|nr:type 1 glutamine amidotransferase [Methanotrichaceae archaeon]
MKIHYLQHVPFEGPANIEAWAKSRGHDLSGTRLFSDEKLPELANFDWLIVMGGPMNIYEHDKYPWLVREKEFIGQAIARSKIVLGICLGAQLMADVLSGIVQRNEYREIGWFPVELTEEAKASPLFAALPERFTALHWHGDTFEIPAGAMRAAESQACPNQAFVLGKAVGLQFHLESSQSSIASLLQNCADELTEGPYVQKPDELLAQPDQYSQIRGLMERFLDNMESLPVNI